MLAKNEISKLFIQLNNKLRDNDIKGELGIVGGAVMCVVFDSRASTKDVDGIFKPSTEIRELAEEIAKENNIPTDWLNDGAKGFLAAKFERNEVTNLSNLLVWAPEPKCMLAMKCISARWDTSDRDDVEFLINHIGLTDAQSVLENIDQFYPKNIVPAKTQFFIEELMEGIKKQN
jgi:hypothetical protein